MDSALQAAARALAVFDPLGALKNVALRTDAPGLALRGIAMAQLGELARARQLLREAKRKFPLDSALAQARCTVAEAEVALALHDLRWSQRPLERALVTLEERGDHANALYARLILVRRSLLLGQITAAEAALAELGLLHAPPMLVAAFELVKADVALRRVKPQIARAAFERARRAAERARHPALVAEVERAARALTTPAARLVRRGEERALLLDDVERLLASGALVTDACCRSVRHGSRSVVLAKRPVLFALARALSEAFPDEVPRATLLRRAFGAQRVSESLRARLRVEIGRLRRELRGLCALAATEAGFVLVPQKASEVVVLAPPSDDEASALFALLATSTETWSTSALGTALGCSQRTVQRALAALEEARKVQSIGQGRARRWLAPPPSAFTTTLLLPAQSGPGDNRRR